MADGEKNGEKIGRDRDAQQATVAALSRDIAAVKKREEAKASEMKGKGTKGGSGGLAHLGETKAAVRTVFFYCSIIKVLWVFEIHTLRIILFFSGVLFLIFLFTPYLFILYLFCCFLFFSFYYFWL